MHVGARGDRAVAADGGAQLRPAELGAGLQPGVRAAHRAGEGREGGGGERAQAWRGAQHLRAQARGGRVPRGRQIHPRRPLPRPERSPPRLHPCVPHAFCVEGEREPVVEADHQPARMAQGGGHAAGAGAGDLAS